MFKLENNEFRRTNHSKPDCYNESAFKNILGCHCIGKTNFDKKGLFRFAAGESAIAPKRSKEIADHSFNTRPGVCIIRFKDDKFSRFSAGVFDKEECTANIDVTPFITVA